jgi:proteasome lid subunit RPN8/RPN11
VTEKRAPGGKGRRPIETRLILDGECHAEIVRAAKAAFPRECCGLIEGVRDGEAVRVTAVHPTVNLALDDNSFAIDPVEQFRLLRAARAEGRFMVGCYHSHPSGRAVPSPRDAERAQETGFVWLIAALAGPDGPCDLAGFLWQADGFHKLVLSGLA